MNAPGTSIACTTEADAVARIAATGATGGVAGSGAAAPAPPSTKPATPPPANAPAALAASAPAAGGDFKLQNAKDAQGLNAKFATLDANSACTGMFT